MEQKFYSLPNLSLRDKIPVPPRKPLPLEVVPLWSQLPYDTKYPLSECSKIAVTLTTEELGKSVCIKPYTRGHLNLGIVNILQKVCIRQKK